jgi:ankyrin repeat protein
MNELIKPTYLHYAILENDVEAVKLFIRSGVDINVGIERSFKRESMITREVEMFKIYPLGLAVENDLTTIVKLLTEAGADVKDEFLFTSLYFENLESFKILLKKLGNINIQNKDGETFLHKKAFCGSIEIVDFLIESGADVNIKDNQGRIPLHLASQEYEIGEQKTRLLIKSGSDVNAKDKNGSAPIHNATSWGCFSNRTINSIKALIESGADVNIKDNQGKTALHLSASSFADEIVELLIKSGADINIKDNDGKTALDYAFLTQSQRYADEDIYKQGKNIIKLLKGK